MLWCAAAGRSGGGPLADRDEQLAWAWAFFLVIPVGVLLHECGHALATWSVGGDVARLSWRVYWGFVVPVGDFGAVSSWWIALAGNLVGLLFGVGLLALATKAGRWRPAAGHVLLIAGQLEIVFTLIVYPLMTLDRAFVSSDWRTIYDFGVTPVASSIVVAAHAGLLGGLWVSRRRLDELRWAVGRGRVDELQRAKAAIAAAPADAVAHGRLASLFLDGHHPRWAAEAAARGLERCGEDASLYGILGVALVRRYAFDEALGPLTRGEEISGATRETALWIRAHRAIALAATGRTADALAAFSLLEEPIASDRAVQAWRERAQAEANRQAQAPP